MPPTAPARGNEATPFVPEAAKNFPSFPLEAV
jgi:hypothetical protein